MKNMKKAIAALAAGVMALTIAACGGGSGSNTASKIHNDKKANDSAPNARTRSRSQAWKR